jgi:PEP-CTERM motif
MLTWNGDSITAVTPASFNFLGDPWKISSTGAVPNCTQPCAVTFSGGDSAFDQNFVNITATAKTPDSLAGVAAVPEPGTLALFALGGLGLAAIRRTRRGL